MAGFYRYTAVLDACVLYPAPLRDLLLSLAAAGVFRGRWTHRIQDEWIRNLLANRPDLQPDALRRTAAMMNDVIEDGLIEKFEYLIDSLTLPDPDDRHVLAAAIVGRADAIVTFNRRDFPQTHVGVFGIDILHPDDFLVAQYERDPLRVLASVKANRARLRNPPKRAAELILTYETQGLPQIAKILSNAVDLI
ncbi:MAG: PIN domain-containing protein [Pseudomonadota bacterium]|nr:PIN domain-containing protein [Pseudomonadota bacterium]